MRAKTWLFGVLLAVGCNEGGSGDPAGTGGEGKFPDQPVLGQQVAVEDLAFCARIDFVPFDFDGDGTDDQLLSLLLLGVDQPEVCEAEDPQAAVAELDSYHFVRIDDTQEVLDSDGSDIDAVGLGGPESNAGVSYEVYEDGAFVAGAFADLASGGEGALTGITSESVAEIRVEGTFTEAGTTVDGEWETVDVPFELLLTDVPIQIVQQ